MFALRWRDETGNRKIKKVKFKDFRPYFYILANAPQKDHILVTEFGNTFRIDIFYDIDGAVSLDGRQLKRVTWNPPKPGHTRILRKEWDETFEADVPFHYRYAIDNLTEIPEYDLVKWYWDLEWQQGGEHDGAITCISLTTKHGSQGFTWFPYEVSEDFRIPEHSNIIVHNDEKDMLEALILLLNKVDPDMLISWFGSKFDLPKLIERLHANGLDPRELSPYNDVKGVYFADGIQLSKNVNSYNPVEQPIRGRIVLNLDLAFERQWNDSQQGTLPSMALDYVTELVLGEKKLVSEKFPDKNEFFQRGWLEDTETYLEYAKKDVELIKRIDETNHTTEAILSLQRLLKAPFDACFYASNMGGIYFMRNASWKAPTGKKGHRVSYDGAMVYDPLSEGTNGLHLGVAAFDFAGLYPAMLIARNISWETKSNIATEFAINIKTPKDFSDNTDTEMKYFKTEHLGLLPQAVLELKVLRNEYKKKMNQADNQSDYSKWNNNQLAVKRLMASFYGIVAYQGFGWADVELAECITASARQAIREAAFKVRELDVCMQG